MKNFYRLSEQVHAEGLIGAVGGAIRGAVQGMKAGWAGSQGVQMNQPQNQTASQAGSADQNSIQQLSQLHQALGPLVRIINGLQQPLNKEVNDIYRPFAQGIGKLIQKYHAPQNGQ